ncbi:hypothetical protein Tco_1193863 [Tanacetum coccineum]
MAVIYNHHTHPLVAAVVVVYDDVRVAVLGLPWGGSGRGDGDGDDVGANINNGHVLTTDVPTWTPSALNYLTCAYTGCPHLDTLSIELLDVCLHGCTHLRHPRALILLDVVPTTDVPPGHTPSALNYL